MPQIDDQNENQYPSVSLLIRTALKNYEIAIDKYENLLVDTTSLNVLIKEKLSQLPIKSEIHDILLDLTKQTDQKIQYQQDKLENKESGNKITTDQLIKDLTGHVKDLLFRLKVVLIWLTVISIVGAAAIGYIKLVLDADLKAQTAKIISTRGPQNQPNVVSYWIDEKGVKRYIYVENLPHESVQTNNSHQ